MASVSGAPQTPGAADPVVRSLVERLESDSRLGPMIVHRRTVEGRRPEFADPQRPFPQQLQEALRYRGIEQLYAHQARATDLARSGKNVVAVTPTASGKTLIFALPVLESALEDPRSKALFLYPTKALAQDQVGSLGELSSALGPFRTPRFEIYDGDTPQHRRKKIRADPPEVLVTNPDMLHMGILSHHQDWADFLRQLRWVVLDEMHVYRGVFGAHVHHILQRLRRLCADAGGRPQFIGASATVGNAGEFAETLVGEPFEMVDESGAPSAPLHVRVLNPVAVSPYTTAVRAVARAADAGLKTIAFTKARRTTELLHTWLVQQEPQLRGKVAPYRAGYLPEERRDLENRLFRGELSAVLSTSALELGIDVGALDVCVLVGYPGSLTSTWQRIGRVGRKDREALAIMIAMPDALDQYVAQHPELLFNKGFERVVLDPNNPFIAERHLICAASERPIDREELERAGEARTALADKMLDEGNLRLDAAGERYFSFRRKPHREVNLRTAAQPFTIVEKRSGRLLGQIDGMRVHHECHPGAIYLHGGRSFLVTDLDTEKRKATVEQARVDYYTVVMGEKETEILERLDRRELELPVPGSDTPHRVGVGLGRLKVTVRIRGFQKKRLFGGEPISAHDLEAPPLIFETVGFWIELPPEMPVAFKQRRLHFMGGIHAAEHAMIALFPLLAIADRGDVGGISYTGHPQLGRPAIFLYDGMAGGAGLAARGFRDLPDLITRTRAMIESCECEEGCPGCIQSPRCGNGNKPLDKRASLLVLGFLEGREAIPELETIEPADLEALAKQTAARPPRKHGIVRAGNVEPGTAAPARAGALEPGPDGGNAAAALPAAGSEMQPRAAPPRGGAPAVTTAERVLVLDVETQHSAADVGGWGNVDRMGLALAVVYDAAADCYVTYYESDVHRLLLDLVMADRVVGFNLDRFDLPVLSGYTDQDLSRIRTCDMLEEIYRRTGFRLSLNHLGEANFGIRKAGDGLQSLQWWKQGRIDLIESYCRGDVEITTRLYKLGRDQGYLLYRDKEERLLRVPVSW
ncbi:hypothetical protein ABI59_06435 [Acidobacteria bacterium Mor1]|nr:hypothetical protein ABI59_06435 [Acidobacteria bacterium Mor1]